MIVWMTPLGPTVLTVTLPLVALITVPKGIWRIPVSGTKMEDPGSLTSPLPDTGATLPLTPNFGGGGAAATLPRTPDFAVGPPSLLLPFAVVVVVVGVGIASVLNVSSGPLLVPPALVAEILKW